MPKILRYRDSKPRLGAEGLRGREGNPYLPHPDLLAAANAALAIERPLLLTGEAGCGKTDFAYAAAQGLAPAGSELGKPFECYVRSDTRARDLLYHYDAIRRFGDAQHGGEEGRQRAEDPEPYLSLQPLGQGLMASQQRVVLIDEIDKAPRDLPNDLLRELDQGEFEIPEIPADPGKGKGSHSATFHHTMRGPNPKQKPFVIITSNVERQLPDPFLRRCVFFHISFPATEDLRSILKSRFPESADLFLDRVIDLFEALRAVPQMSKKPATSELIDWVEALRELYHPEEVLQAFNRLMGGEENKARDARWNTLPWAELPAWGCLIKLREDQQRLQGRL